MRHHGGEQSGLVTFTFDLLTLKVVSESRVAWTILLPILVLLIASLFSTYARCTRQTDVRQYHRFMLPPIRGVDVINGLVKILSMM